MKTHFTTNKTSRNGSGTSKPEATAPTVLPSTHQNTNSEHCRNTAHRLKTRKTNSQVTSTSSHTSRKILEIKTTFKAQGNNTTYCDHHDQLERSYKFLRTLISPSIERVKSINIRKPRKPVVLVVTIYR